MAEQVRSPVSVHILDQQSGKPANDVSVTLERKEGNGWVAISSGVTDQDGRIKSLYPNGSEFQPGSYRVTFKTGAYFKRNQQATFFPEIPVEVDLGSASEHYHIPLLVSPFGYSTYRGS